MIGWLQGQRIDNWKQSQKQGVVLSCSGVGYEIQLIPRYLSLIASLEELTLWIHQVKREDGESLYGFETRTERDLFRKLIAVNGVGPQMAMALLEEVQVEELVSAIISEDTNTLSKAQGIGKRTAERLSVELRNKLEDFNRLESEFPSVKKRQSQNIPCNSSNLYELHNTLKTLGYEDIEIRRAVDAVASKTASEITSKEPVSAASMNDFEGLLKESLIWLSNESG